GNAIVTAITAAASAQSTTEGRGGGASSRARIRGHKSLSSGAIKSAGLSASLMSRSVSSITVATHQGVCGGHSQRRRQRSKRPRDRLARIARLDARGGDWIDDVASGIMNV